jgi:hypothetical protein
VLIDKASFAGIGNVTREATPPGIRIINITQANSLVQGDRSYYGVPVWFDASKGPFADYLKKNNFNQGDAHNYIDDFLASDEGKKAFDEAFNNELKNAGVKSELSGGLPELINRLADDGTAFAKLFKAPKR